MDNNKVTNPKTEVQQTKNMNDRDYLNNVLQSIKNLSNNLSIAINEASNRNLFNDYMNMFINSKEAQRDLYDLMFKNGWYALEKAEQQKIDEKITEFQPKLNEL